LEGPHMGGGALVLSVGTHAFSKDGFTWQYGGLAYTSKVPCTDGSDIHLVRRERPHLVFAENSRRPVALSNSAALSPNRGLPNGRSVTLVVGIDQSNTMN